MKINFLQFLISIGISILFIVLLGGKLELNNKGLYSLISFVTFAVYLSILIGFRFKNRKLKLNITALTLLFFCVNLIVTIIYKNIADFDFTKYIAFHFIPLLIFLSILLSIKDLRNI
jgi:hypothetical protein